MIEITRDNKKMNQKIQGEITTQCVPLGSEKIH
jgi:hypothetical protein